MYTNTRFNINDHEAGPQATQALAFQFIRTYLILQPSFYNTKLLSLFPSKGRRGWRSRRRGGLVLLLLLRFFLLLLLLLRLHPCGTHSASSPYKATEFTPYRLGWSKRPSIPALSIGFLLPSLVGGWLGKTGMQWTVKGVNVGCRENEERRKGIGRNTSVYWKCGGQGTGKEGTLLRLLITVAVTIVATSVR